MNARFFQIVAVAILSTSRIDVHCQSQTTSQRVQGQYQKSDYYANLKPSDPERAALGSFGKTPINYYTGIPEVSLNLLTLTSRDLSLPITINYDPTGVKLNDISGPVGMKWNLDAGGYVARQLNGGYPDEEPNLGYWKYESGINGSLVNVDLKTWATACEQNTRDFEPDEFVVFVNGRSIKFFFKSGIPTLVPLQNVSITYTLLNNKINQFVLITEDGTKYVFGGSASTIEERKIETLNIGGRYDVDYVQDLIFVDYYDYPWKPADGYELVGTFNTGNFGLNPRYQTVENSRPYYNDKWYLVSITSPGGDQVNFTYSNDGYQKYVTATSISRIDNVLQRISPYNFDVIGYCVKESWIDCETRQSFTFNHDNVFAYATFDSDCLTNNCQTGFDWTDNTSLPISQAQTDLYYDPRTVPDAGGYSINQSLITESVIRLVSITSSVGNKIQFTASSRTDLPSAIRYDRIDLYNLNNQMVKSVKLNYSVVDADISQDYLWLSEAYMATRFTNLNYTSDGGHSFYAHHFNVFNASDVNSQVNADNPAGLNAVFQKYVFEGLKDYNFKRLFLDNIVETVNSNDRQLYGFEYKDRSLLRRRNSPMQDDYGFSANYTGTLTSTGYSIFEQPFLIGSVYAMVIRSSRPSISPFSTSLIASVSSSRGLLTKITYPTQGSTEFSFTDSQQPRLVSVQDKDESGSVVQKRELNYLLTDFSSPSPVTISYRNVKVPNSTKYFQIRVVSSYPQNRRFRPSHGVYQTYSSVKVYNGSSSDHKGYEIFNYRNDSDMPTEIVQIAEDGTTQYGSGDIFPFPKDEERDHLRGALSDHSIYDKSSNLISHVNNYYGVSSYPQIYAFYGGSFSFNNGPPKYRYSFRKIRSHLVQLLRTTKKVYDQTLPQDLTKYSSTVTEYTYDNTSLQLTGTKTYNEINPGSYVSTKTKYPTDPDYNFDVTSYCTQRYNDCLATCPDKAACGTCQTALNNCRNGALLPWETFAIKQLRLNGQINSPVEVQSWLQENSTSKLLSAVVYKYNAEGTTKFIKAKEVWGLKQPLDASSYATSKVNSSFNFTIDPKLRKLHNYDSYDQTTGNLLQQTTLDGTVSTYQWGFNNSLVTGATVNPGSLQQTSLFVHQPGVGITQTTDPNGRNTNYTYDGFNRLRTVKDHDSNIQSRYRYHYIGQNEYLNGVMTISSCRIVNQSITFSCSDNADFGQTTYTWDFGDGSTATGSNVSHAYAATGTYIVKLKKNNPEQFANDLTQTLTIVPSNASISICADGPVKIDVCGVNATLYGTCTTTNNTDSSPTVLKISGGGGIVSYQWQYQANGGAWQNMGTSTTQSSPPEFDSWIVGSYVVQCIGYDSCGNAIASNQVTLRIVKSSQTCSQL